MQITYACVTVPRLSALKRNLPIVLPWVDRAVIVTGERDEAAESYLGSLGPKVEWHYHEWCDSFCQQYSHIFDYINSGWVLLCYDNDTEVLTGEGWKYFRDIKTSDDVLTIDSSTKRLSYQRPTRHVRYQYTGPLHTYEGKSCNFSVTPDHRMIVRPNGNPESPYRRMPVSEMMQNKKAAFLCAGTWDRLEPDPQLIPGVDNDLVARITGWVLAEGWTYKHEFRHKIYISQTKEEGRQEIQGLIRGIGRSPIQDNDHTFVFYHRELYDLLSEIGRGAVNKSIPRQLLNMGPGFLQSMLEAYLRGDGTPEGSGGWVFSTVSKGLVDGIQEICIKLGWRCTFTEQPPRTGGVNSRGQQIVGRHPIFVGCISRHSSVCIQTEEIFPREYSGEVFCLTVPNHTVCVRRGGRAMFSGNCDDDEVPSEALLKSLRPLAEQSQGRYGAVEYRCNPVDDGRDGGPCNYWRRIYFEVVPGMQFRCHLHQYLVGARNNRAIRSDNTYFHIKTTVGEHAAAARNWWIGGVWLPGPRETGEKPAEWHEMRRLVALHHPEVKLYRDLDRLMVANQVHPEFKRWIVQGYRNRQNHPHYNEMRSFYTRFFVHLHPEEQPEDYQ